MPEHPVSIARTLSNAALVVVLGAFVIAAALGLAGSGYVWAMIIGGVALTGALAQFAASLAWRRGIEAAWDEQVQATYTSSLAFGYWATMAALLVFFALTLWGRMSPASAFYWLAPVLAGGPSLYMLIATLRGRAT